MTLIASLRRDKESKNMKKGVFFAGSAFLTRHGGQARRGRVNFKLLTSNF
jgi:hypothetical protein